MRWLSTVPVEHGMKAEERHELAENDLAEGLETMFERYRPHLATGLVVAIAGLVGVIAWQVIAGQWQAGRAQSWDGCLAALASGDEEVFRDVIRRHPQSRAALWAELVLADRAISQGTDLLFTKVTGETDRARELIGRAADSYLAILAAGPGGMVGERATLGLAKARESLGEFAEARRGYETLSTEFSSSPLASLAARHARSLDQEATSAWYDWFSAQRVAAEPPPAPPAAADQKDEPRPVSEAPDTAQPAPDAAAAKPAAEAAASPAE